MAGSSGGVVSSLVSTLLPICQLKSYLLTCWEKKRIEKEVWEHNISINFQLQQTSFSPLYIFSSISPPHIHLFRCLCFTSDQDVALRQCTKFILIPLVQHFRLKSPSWASWSHMKRESWEYIMNIQIYQSVSV